MPLLSKKITSLVRRVFQLTQEESLRWEETGREGVYQVVIAGYSVRIAEEPADDPAQPPRYALRICNAKGVVLEEVSGKDLETRIPDSQAYMHDIYVRARRIALDVETALDQIIRQLEEEQPGSTL
jgi:hypothetical protein